jgi:hypothetical protein
MITSVVQIGAIHVPVLQNAPRKDLARSTMILYWPFLHSDDVFVLLAPLLDVPVLKVWVQKVVVAMVLDFVVLSVLVVGV